jgi:hypothetical protein
MGMKQGCKKQSQAASAAGVENAASDGCRTSSRLAKKRTTQAELTGINAEHIESSSLVAVVAVEGDEPESITSDDGPKTLVSYAVVVRLCLSCKSNGTALFLTRCVLRILQEPNKEDLVASSRIDNADDDNDDEDDYDDNGGGKPRASNTVLVPSDAVRRRRLLTTVEYMRQV